MPKVYPSAFFNGYSIGGVYDPSTIILVDIQKEFADYGTLASFSHNLPTNPLTGEGG